METIAHRGIPSLYPENSGISFLNALKYKPGQIEFDVQMTKDGEFVVIHDFTLDRTTDSSGLVRKKTLKELKNISAFNKMEEFRNEKILSLDDVLSMIPRVQVLNIEIKRETIEKEPWEIKLVDYLLKRRNPDEFILSSMNHETLKNSWTVSDKLRLGLALEGNLVNLDDYIKSLDFKIYSFHPCIDYVDRERVRDIQSMGIKVYPWTVNDMDTVKKMKECEVDGFMTNILDKLV